MTNSIVFVVDDDAAIRDSLSLLLETAGLEVECHDSAESFLAAYRGDRPGCLLLDVRMQGLSGPDLHAELVRRGSLLPVIFLTAHGDIPTTVRAMKAGAVDFLTKPVDPAMLLTQVRAALQLQQQSLERHQAQASQRQRLADLTPREHEIMALVLAGHSNKAIARELGISFRTVEIHRSRVLQKTGTGNPLELAQLVAECGLEVGNSRDPDPPPDKP